MKSRKGFTLIELMVVILIVGILAAVAIPILRGRIDAAKWSEGKAMMGSIATAMRAWHAEKGPAYTGTRPNSLATLGFAAGDCTGNYFADADFTTISITGMDPLTFTIVCGPVTQTERPSTPASVTMTGNADGTVTWNP